MAKIRTYSFDKLLAKQMRNKEFREAYEDLEGEYELAKQVIRLRVAPRPTQMGCCRKYRFPYERE